MQQIEEIGILALASRMKRLYDQIQQQVKATYTAYQLDFDPKWFTVTYALIENKQASITELANILGFSHPSIIRIVKELEKAGWVTSKINPEDGRVRLLSLSETALQKVPQLQQIWQDMRKAVERMNAEGQVDFWAGLRELEASLSKTSFRDRVLDIQQQYKSNAMQYHRPAPWFDRIFNFEQLSTKPEGLLERLRFTPLRIQEIVKHIPSEKLRQGNTRWSIKQNIGHLSDLEPVWQGRIQDILAEHQTMRAVDLTNKKTHEADHNFVNIEKHIADFSAQRQQLVALCHEHFDQLQTASALHPRLQIPMRIIDLMYFVAEHDDHHLATINYLIHQN